LVASSCVTVQPASYLAKEDDEISTSVRGDIRTLGNIISLIQKNDFEAFCGYFVTGIKDDNALKQQIKDQFPVLVEIT